MDRSPLRLARTSLTLLLVAVLMLGSSGCNLVATVLYVVNGQNEPADFPGLKGKRVAVVCRPIMTLQFNSDNGSVSRDLCKQVTALLKKNVPRIEVIDYREVSQWTDENEWDDFNKIGQALGADMIVGIDLLDFNLFKDMTLYQGKANVTITVHDIAKDEKDPVYENTLPQFLYPAVAPISSSEIPVPQFRRKFIMALSEQIARHFYDHDRSVDFANDSTATYQ
jgi:hypothetical protein